MRSSYAFTVGYLGSVFGEPTAVSADDVIFSHPSVPGGYAVYYTPQNDLIRINRGLQATLLHQIVGYCVMNDLDWHEFGEFL